MIRVDGVFERNGLGILHINRFTFGQAPVVGIGDFFGALFRAQAAGDTFIRIYVAWLLDQLDFEIACFSAYAFNFGKGQKFDIDVPADLDQFR